MSEFTDKLYLQAVAWVVRRNKKAGAWQQTGPGQEGSPTWGYKEEPSSTHLTADADASTGVGMAALRGNTREDDEPRPSFQSYENNAPGVTVSDLLSNGQGYGVVPQHVSNHFLLKPR